MHLFNLLADEASGQTIPSTTDWNSVAPSNVSSGTSSVTNTLSNGWRTTTVAASGSVALQIENDDGANGADGSFNPFTNSTDDNELFGATIGFGGAELNAVDYLAVESTASENFKLNSLRVRVQLQTVSSGTLYSYTLHAFRGGSQVGTASGSVNSSDGSLRYWASINVASNSDFENIDEFRVDFSAGVRQIGIDDISISAAVAGDTTAPRVTSVARQTPSDASTNADTLIFRVTFDEDVQNVDATDFNASGTSGDASSVATVNASTYDVTVSGGDLASYNGAVGLSFDGSQNIQDLAGNNLTNTTPTGANESYTLNNTAPTLAEVTPVTTPTADATPSYTFSSDEAGAVHGRFLRHVELHRGERGR